MITKETLLAALSRFFYNVDNLFARKADVVFEKGRGTDSAQQKHGSNDAHGELSVSEGSDTDSGGFASHAEGDTTHATGDSSHSEGLDTVAEGNNSHAEGNYTYAVGDDSHAEGDNATSEGENSHAEGYKTYAFGANSHIEGRSQSKASETTAAKDASGVVSDWNSTKFAMAKGHSSHAEGFNGLSLGDYSHVEGANNIAWGSQSHSEGSTNTAYGLESHAEGLQTYAFGANSHTEGRSKAKVSDAIAGSPDASIILNWETANNKYTLAKGNAAHAEGFNSLAIGNYSHVEGAGGEAIGTQSHAEGNFTKALNDYEHAEGSFNISIPNVTRHTVGIGSSLSVRKNAHVITADGKHYIPGIGGVDGTEGTASALSQKTDLATYLNSLVGGTGPRRIVTSLNVYTGWGTPITLNLDLYNGRFGLDSAVVHIYDHDGQNIIYTLYTNIMNSLGQSIKQQSDLDGIYNDIVNYFSNATFDLFTTSDGTITHNLYQCREYGVDTVNENAHFTFAREDNTENLYYLDIYYGGSGGTGIRLEFEPF